MNMGKQACFTAEFPTQCLNLQDSPSEDFLLYWGNRVSESYARQAGWLIRESPSGKRYMEREINDWAGNTALVVHFLDDDL